MRKPYEQLPSQAAAVSGATNFAEPWQARVFALALALVERGVFSWEGFRDALIAEIAVAGEESGARYFECWLKALEAVLGSKSIIDSSELDRTAAEIAANPPAPTRAISTGPIKVA
jgi:nitrile hydratase accessory protein